MFWAPWTVFVFVFVVCVCVCVSCLCESTKSTLDVLGSLDGDNKFRLAHEYLNIAGAG